MTSSASTSTTTATDTTSGEPDTGSETSAPGTTVPGTTTVEPCEPATCDANECGSINDGCGGQVDCGGCGEGLSCMNNTCGAKAFTKATVVWKTSATTYPVRGVAWSADGGRIATAGCEDFPTEGELVVWDAMDGGPVWGHHYTDPPIWTLAWSPDGAAVVLGGRVARPLIHSATTGTLMAELIGCHDGELNGVDWRADGQQIVSAGGTAASPGANPEWCVWGSASHENLHKEVEYDTYAVRDIAYSADGKKFAAVTDDVLTIYNASDNSVDDFVDFGGSFEDPWAFDGLAWSPDNKRLIVWTYEAFFLVDLDGGDILYLDVPEGVTEGTWSPSGHRYAIALADGKVRVFNYVANTFEVEFKAHDVATTIDWSHHEQFLATGGEIPRLAVWRLDY